MAISNDDLFYIWDTDAAQGKKIKFSTLKGAYQTGVVVTTATDQDIEGNKGFKQAVFNYQRIIPNGATWDIKTANLWVTSGDTTTIINPQNANKGQAGLIFTNAEVSVWGNKFFFPGGTIPAVPANSIIPYYITDDSQIRMGFATEGIITTSS